MRSYLVLFLLLFACCVSTQALAQPIEEGPIEEGPIEEGPVDEGPIEEGPVEEGPVEEGPVDEGGQQDQVPELIPPKLKTFVEATYPAKAVEEKVEAVVVFLIDIDVEGKVEKVELAEPAQPPGYGFDEAAADAVKQFVFEPATEAGVPIPVRVTYRYRFALADEVVVPDETDPEETETPEEIPRVVNFKGILLERGTREPLVGVIITVFRNDDEEEAIGFEALTEPDGSFEFIDLELGDWKVVVEPDGYYPFKTTESIAEGELTEVVYFVEKGSYNPFDVVVEGERIRKEVNKRTLTVREIEKIPGTFGDPIKVVKNLPGVARTNALSGDIVVRGSSPEDTQLFIGSVGVPLIYHFGGLRSVVPLGMIDSINFYPGNFSTYYGRAIGGVLDVDIKDLKPERVQGYVDVNIFDSGVFLEAPVTDELSIAVAGRRSYIDFVLENVLPEDAPVNPIAAPAYYDWQVLADWRPNRAHHVKFFLFASDDELELVINNPTFDVGVQSNNISLSTGFIRGILEHTWTPDERLTSTMQLATGSDQIQFNGLGLFVFNLDIYQPSLRETVTYLISDNATLKTGIDIVWSKTDLSINAPLPPQEGQADREITSDDFIFVSQNNIRTRDFAGFLELELKAFDELLFIPGARVDYFEAVDTATFDPRLTVRYDFVKDWTAKGGVGLFHQTPTPDQSSDSGFGNPDLTPEAAIHYSLGVEWTPLEYLLVDTTFFYKDMFDLVTASSDQVERDGEIVPEIYNNEGEGRVYGMELLIRHEFANNFFGWITYTLSRAERLDYGETAYRLFDFDQTHILTLIGSYQLPRNWEVGMRWRYVTGSPTTLNVGGIYNTDSGEYEPIPGEINGERLEAFHQLDLRIDKRWIYDTWTLNAYIDIQNTYNRGNVEGVSYNFDYSERGVTQGLPILPIIGVKSEF